MQHDLTDITLVVDRSGSMGQVQADAEGGVNSFIKEQSRESGEALLTLLQFDTKYELVHKGVSISEVPSYALVPRGMTALLDAIGRAINETGERLAALNQHDRPGLVIFVIMTDGLENSSKEFSKASIREMIKHQQDVYQWQFTFLGANQDAFAEADDLGIDLSGVANVSMDKMPEAYAATGAKVSRMRAQLREGEQVRNVFTDVEKDAMGP